MFDSSNLLPSYHITSYLITSVSSLTSSGSLSCTCTGCAFFLFLLLVITAWTPLALSSLSCTCTWGRMRYPSQSWITFASSSSISQTSGGWSGSKSQLSLSCWPSWRRMRRYGSLSLSFSLSHTHTHTHTVTLTLTLTHTHTHLAASQEMSRKYWSDTVGEAAVFGQFYVEFTTTPFSTIHACNFAESLAKRALART